MLDAAHRINDILKARFNVALDFSCPVEDLKEIMEHYAARRDAIIEQQNDAVLTSAEYVKSHLITEAVRMYLREIAPRRINKKKRKVS